MNIIIPIAGGIGKCIAGTAFVKAVKKQYPESKIIVSSPYPSVFKHHPDISETILIDAERNSIFAKYCKDQEFKIFIMDPFLHNEFITETNHIIPIWCKSNDIKYNGEKSEIFLTDNEKDYYSNFFMFDKLEKPILAMQVSGGNLAPNIQPGYNWARDLPQETVVKIIEEYRDYYTIINIKREDQQGYNDTIECNSNIRSIAYLLLNSEKRLFIDSFAQHMAAALNLPSTVCWVTTNPIVFGYDIHDNVFANPHNVDFVTETPTYSRYELNESIVDLPWEKTEDIFDVNKIFQSLNKN